MPAYRRILTKINKLKGVNYPGACRTLIWWRGHPALQRQQPAHIKANVKSQLFSEEVLSLSPSLPSRCAPLGTPRRSFQQQKGIAQKGIRDIS